MVKVTMWVEGDTEETFVNRVLRPHLWPLGVNPHPRKLGKPGHYTGMVEYPRARRDILTTLKEDAVSFCTTMVDYYAMPSSWPGREAARQKPFSEKPVTIEQAILADISAALGEGFNSARFIPYVQMHEFEALLFSNPAVLAAHLESVEQSVLQEIKAQFSSPEEIDDSPETAPSKRILRLDPSYRKRYDGMLLAQNIGLNVMRAECPHFNEWIRSLETLAHD
jgi:hypothetical protein